MEVVRAFLKKLVESMEMTPYGEAVVFEYPANGFGGVGFTAMQCLHESYVVYDSWVERDPAYANIVINSCRHFDINKALNMVKLHLNPVSLRMSGPDFYSQDRWDLEVGEMCKDDFCSAADKK